MAAERGDGRPLFEFEAKKDSLFRCDCSANSDQLPNIDRVEMTAAIACGDANPVETDLKTLKELYTNMAKISSFSELWGMNMVCR